MSPKKSAPARRNDYAHTGSGLRDSSLSLFCRRALVAALPLVLASCGHDPVAPTQGRVLTEWVTGPVAASLNAAGLFVRARRSHRYLDQVAAESVGVAVARLLVPAGSLGLLGQETQTFHGSPIDFASLRLCGTTEYIEVATDDLPLRVAGAARRAYGPQWGVMLCAPGSSAAQVAIDVPDGPRDFRVERNEIVQGSLRQVGGGADWRVAAVLPSYPWGIVVSAEQATREVFVTTGRRISAVPRAFAMIDDVSNPAIPGSGCASWRVTVEAPIRVRGLESGAARDVQTLFVRRQNCLTGPISLYAPTPKQPAGRSISFLRDTSGLNVDLADPFDTIVVPVNGLGHFELVTVIP